MFSDQYIDTCKYILVHMALMQTPPGWNVLMMVLTGTAIASLWLPAQQQQQLTGQSDSPIPN
jgi:hypothetical protein